MEDRRVFRADVITHRERNRRQVHAQTGFKRRVSHLVETRVTQERDLSAVRGDLHQVVVDIADNLPGREEDQAQQRRQPVLHGFMHIQIFRQQLSHGRPRALLTDQFRPAHPEQKRVRFLKRSFI